MKAGDKVVCVDPAFELVNGQIYTIHNVYNCGCGDTSFDVGTQLVAPYKGTHCKYCGQILSWGRSLFSSNRFRPVDDTFGPAVCERIEKMREYEYALNNEL